jgi:parallel beta-helix repeat protein
MRSVLFGSLVLGAAAGAAASGCGDDDSACDITVTPGATVDESQTRAQTALVDVGAGQTVCFDGTFQLSDELSLRQDGVTLRGTGEGGVLDFSTQEFGANGLNIQTVAGITLEDLTVKNTLGDGIRVEESTDVVFRRVKMIWDAGPSEDNGAYGLYPVLSENVLIEDCEVSGASDAGVYVGQSRNIVVRNNVVYGNVAGIEIENSFDADVYNNDTHDNTGGILVFDLPNLPAGQGGRVKIHDNTITSNNETNFATPGSIVSYLPTGTGMMILSGDEIEIHNNIVTGHDSTGLLIISYDIVDAVGAGGTPGAEYDPYPEDIYVHDNAFSDNGAMTQGLLVMIGSPLEDILWDGLVAPGSPSANLCIRDNDAATFRNFHIDLSSGLDVGEPTFDLAPHDCEGAVLPAVNLEL